MLFHRRKVRDITERQRSLDFVRWQWDNFVMPSTRRHVLPSKRYADVVIDARPDLSAVEKTVVDAVQQRLARAASAK